MKKDLEEFIGKYLPRSVSDQFTSLDGSCVAKWLESSGEAVVRFKDMSSYGAAFTCSGLKVSTSGYVSRCES